MNTDVVTRLLEQLRLRGLSVGPGRKPGELMLHGPREAATEEVMLAVTAFKRELLRRFAAGAPAAPAAPEPEPAPELCDVCGRDVSDAENRERLADALFCDRAGSRAVTDGLGRFHPETRRCPWKP